MCGRLRNGFNFLHSISWDPYNEAEDLILCSNRIERGTRFFGSPNLAPPQLSVLAKRLILVQ